MPRIDAWLLLAQVIQRHADWHRSVDVFPCRPVRQDHMSTAAVLPTDLRVSMASR
jgi:hypothetical protein